MAIYNWSALTNGQVVAFVPASDAIVFNDPAISAAAVTGFAFTNATDTVNGTFSLTFGGKTVTFGVPGTSPAPFASLTSTNLVFVDGSVALIGDNTIAASADNSANTLTGGAGNDLLIGLGGNDTLIGGAGNDTFYAAYSTAALGNDTIDGGDGFDSLIYVTSSTEAVTVNLATHSASNSQGTATLTSIETVLGTAGNDVFVGGDAAHGINSQGDSITERFRGNSGNDSITGGAGMGFYTIADYANNSSVQVVSANLQTGVALDGRGGTDTLVNVDGLHGGAGNDMLTGGSLSRSQNGVFFEFYRGNAGNDTLNGNNAASGSFGSDRADYSNNTTSQSVLIDFTIGSAFDGLGGTDTLIDINQAYGGAGNDTFIGSDGDEDFDGGFGNDSLIGGLGRDTARFQQSTAGVTVNLSASSITVGTVTVSANSANDGMGGTDTLSGIEAVIGSNFNDYLRGSDDVNVREFLQGDAGNDTLNGGAGIDFASYALNALVLGGINAFIENGSGTVNDRMGGTDTLINIEGLVGTNTDDVLSGGLGVQWFRGGGGSDTINGGADNDWVTYENSPTAVRVDLTSGKASDGWNGVGGILALGGTDTLISIENVEGSAFDDIITGNTVANVLTGGLGADYINGGAGNDILDGGDGNDILEGGGGSDTLSGGIGNDSLTGSDGDDTITGGAGTDALIGLGGTNTMTGGADSDVYYSYSSTDVMTEASGVAEGDDAVIANYNITLANNIERLVLLNGATSAFGNGSDNLLFGLEITTGGISLDGGGGNDVLYGTSTGADTLTGGIGNDALLGFGGANVMNGGDGDDTYYSYSASDTIIENTAGAPGGIDRVITTHDIGALAANVENVIILGSASSVVGNGLDNDINGSGSSSGLVINGLGGADVIIGSSQGDLIEGGAGNDFMFGGLGEDGFRFLASGTGADTITDFDSNPAGGQDYIMLTGRGFNAGSIGNTIIISSINAGADTLVTIGADTIRLTGINSGTIDATDFLF